MRITAFILVLASCLPYRGDVRSGETMEVRNAGGALPGVQVGLTVLEGNCMALNNPGTGRIIEQAQLTTDQSGRIRTEQKSKWRMHPCIFATDMGTCVRHCYSVDRPEYLPVDTCDEKNADDTRAGRITLQKPRFARFSVQMKDSFRSGCPGMPQAAKAVDKPRFCECLLRTFDGSIDEGVFLRMTDAEVGPLIEERKAACSGD